MKINQLKKDGNKALCLLDLLKQNQFKPNLLKSKMKSVKSNKKRKVHKIVTRLRKRLKKMDIKPKNGLIKNISSSLKLLESMVKIGQKLQK